MEYYDKFYNPFEYFKSILLYLMARWCILWSFGIFSCFGMLYQKKSGNLVFAERKVFWGNEVTRCVCEKKLPKIYLNLFFVKTTTSLFSM
jgi:hypothetical protein